MSPEDPSLGPGVDDPGAEIEGAGTRRKRRKKRGGYYARIEKDLLVVSLDAELPGVCMKCGSHHELVRRHARFSWTPTWARLSVLLCALPGLVAIALTSHRAELAVPLCKTCDGRWRSARISLVVSVSVFVAVLVGIRLPRTRGRTCPCSASCSSGSSSWRSPMRGPA
ncbi:MAG: hypothetical protein JWP97_1794 [Labilithrix sp.]|nr:hypothetical protein [Labilithrix sp.]